MTFQTKFGGGRFLQGLFVGILFGLGVVPAFLNIRSIRIRNAAPQQYGSVFFQPQKVTHELYSTSYDEATFPFTNLNESRGQTGKVYWTLLKPSFKCPKSLLSRVGNPRDGGKWVCGLEPFGKLTVEKNYPCVCYSFGVGGDSTFETEVIKTTTCSVYAYDMTVSNIARPLTPSNPRVHFHQLGISGSDNNVTKVKALQTLMSENGHTFIDILKVDVEGAEFPSFQKIFEDFPPHQLPFGQLMIELHLQTSRTEKGNMTYDTTLGLVERLEKWGFRLFSIEPNPVGGNCCSELSFINLKYRKLFIPDDAKLANSTLNTDEHRQPLLPQYSDEYK